MCFYIFIYTYSTQIRKKTKAKLVLFFSKLIYLIGWILYHILLDWMLHSFFSFHIPFSNVRLGTLFFLAVLFFFFFLLDRIGSGWVGLDLIWFDYGRLGLDWTGLDWLVCILFSL